MAKSLEPQTLDHLLAQVCHLHHARLHELLSPIGLFRGQPPVLEALWEKDGQTHTELAGQMHVTPATLSRMIKRMAGAGLVETRRDSQDMRVSRVYLTDAGRGVRTALTTAFKTLEEDTFADFTLEERVLLRRFLMQARGNLISVVGVKPFL